MGLLRLVCLTRLVGLAGIEPATSALSGRSGDSRFVPEDPDESPWVLVTGRPDGRPETERDGAGRAGTQLLGQSWDETRRIPRPSNRSSAACPKQFPPAPTHLGPSGMRWSGWPRKGPWSSHSRWPPSLIAGRAYSSESKELVESESVAAWLQGRDCTGPGEHRIDTEFRERRGCRIGKCCRLVGTTLTGNPLREVKLDAGPPVAVAEIAKRSLYRHKGLLHALLRTARRGGKRFARAGLACAGTVAPHRAGVRRTW